MSISLSRGCIVICSGPSEAPSAVSSPRARSLGTDTISRDLPEESLVCGKTKHPPPPVPAIAPPLSSRIPQRAPFPWANDRPAPIESPRTRRPSHDNPAAAAASHLSRYSPPPPPAQMMPETETKTARAHTRVREHRHDGWGGGCHTRREREREGGREGMGTRAGGGEQTPNPSLALSPPRSLRASPALSLALFFFPSFLSASRRNK